MKMLDALLTPNAIAVYGASRNPDKIGTEVVANLQGSGFAGTIVPINPNADEILGLKVYPDLRSCPEKVDMAVISVPVPYVLASAQDAVEAGVKALVVITAGFKETGEEGAKAEKELLALARRYRVRMLGPNCLGLINTQHKMNASFAPQAPQPGNISVISQSGAICTAILDTAAARKLGLAKLVSIGNKADVSENDLLLKLAEDEQTKVIVGYLESIESGDEFIKAAEQASAIKPVVIIKAGRTAAGVKAASSHTGSLAGGAVAYGAAFKRSGVVQAEVFEDLFDYATAFAMQPLPKGDRVAIITNAGGAGILAADAVEQSGMRITSLGKGTATALRKRLPAAASVGNPIDVLGDADPGRYVTAIKAAQKDDSVDAIIVILAPTAMTDPATTAIGIADALTGKKPVLAVFMGGRDVIPGREVLVARGLPEYTSPERAVAALRAMVDYVEWKNRPPRIVTRFPVNRRRVERVIRRNLRAGRRQVGEVDAKMVLDAYGFNIPPGGLATSAGEAIEIGERIGLPAAMKIVSPDIIHKSDFGGVKLNLASPVAVRDAYDLMMIRIKERAPKARIDGVYVEKMAPPGREVIVGMTRDAKFGPMLMFGLGGIFVEVMRDVAFHLAPITEEEAKQMLESTRSYALLVGARGESAVDTASIATSIQRLSQLVTDFPQIVELDINPFIVAPVGQEPVVADARLSLVAEGEVR